MPLYEYECFVCKKRFEKIQKVSDDPVRECPHCAGSVRRLLGVPALQFKGSGWYVTDYAGGRSEASATAGESNGNGATDKDTSTSDSNGKDSKTADSSDSKAKNTEKAAAAS